MADTSDRGDTGDTSEADDLERLFSDVGFYLPKFASVEEERRTARSASRRASGSSPASATTRASPATSPRATPSGTTTSGSTRSACTSRTSGSATSSSSTTRVRSCRATRPSTAPRSRIHAQRPRGPTRRRRGRALPLDARQVVVHAGSAPRPAHAGRLRVLRGPRPLRRLHRRRARPRGGQAHRHALGDNKAVILRNHGLLTVGHSRRRSGLVVHHDGPLVPRAAARRGRGHADAHRPRHGPAHLRSGRGARSAATEKQHLP